MQAEAEANMLCVRREADIVAKFKVEGIRADGAVQARVHSWDFVFQVRKFGF